MQDRSDLEGFRGVEIHPDTKPDDPVLASPHDPGRIPPSQQKELSPSSQGTSLAPPFTPQTPYTPPTPRSPAEGDSRKGGE